MMVRGIRGSTARPSCHAEMRETNTEQKTLETAEPRYKRVVPVAWEWFQHQYHHHIVLLFNEYFFIFSLLNVSTIITMLLFYPQS